MQRRAGVRERAEQMSETVEQTVPSDDDVRALIQNQPHAVVTSVEDDRTVHFSTRLPAGDPLADHLRPEMPAGVLLVDPRNRNRLRLNGTATLVDGGFELVSEEVFPDCPKYIQRRSFERITDETAGAGEPRTTETLTANQRTWIETTDTFFIGSHHPSTGADASHRGGDPGFVDVANDTIVYPDYPGNSMFYTLGNVEATSRVGLLFVDFEDGRTLQVTGAAEVVWDEERVGSHEGAERLVGISVDQSVELPDGNPLRWSFEERSPFNP